MTKLWNYYKMWKNDIFNELNHKICYVTILWLCSSFDFFRACNYFLFVFLIDLHFRGQDPTTVTINDSELFGLYRFFFFKQEMRRTIWYWLNTRFSLYNYYHMLCIVFFNQKIMIRQTCFNKNLFYINRFTR